MKPRIFPCAPGAKFPKSKNWQTTARPDSFIPPTCNVGVVTGEGFVVIDLDTPKGEDQSADGRLWLKHHKADLPVTCTVATPSGGAHLYYRLPDSVTVGNTVSALAPGIDTRATGGLVVIPPSRTPEGEYRALRGDPRDLETFSMIPDWLLGELQRIEAKRLVASIPCSQEPAVPDALEIPDYIRRAQSIATRSLSCLGAVDNLRDLPTLAVGGRNDAAFKLACVWASWGVGWTTAQGLMRALWEKCQQGEGSNRFEWPEAQLCLTRGYQISSQSVSKQQEPVVKATSPITPSSPPEPETPPVCSPTPSDPPQEPAGGEEAQGIAAGFGGEVDPEAAKRLEAGKAKFEYPDKTKNGKILNTRENLEALMQAYKITARYSLVEKKVDLTVPGLVSTVDNKDNSALAELSSLAARHALPREGLVEYVKAIADRNSYSPVADWIQSVEWDGKDRLQAFCNTLEADDNALRDVLVKRWLIQAVAAAVMPHGFWCKGVLTLQGPQDMGKTSWFKALVPPEMHHLIQDGLHLDVQKKDSVITAVSKWLVELGELPSTLRRDMDSLKAFITQRTDKLRRPYDRVDSEYPRRTVFCASANDDRFLKDTDGNSRFWVLRCKAINYTHGLDMQQVWGQVYEQLYLKGEQWHLTAQEQAALNASNEVSREHSPLDEMIPDRFEAQARDAGTPMKATQVLLELGYDKPTRTQQLEAAAALKKLFSSRIKDGCTVYDIRLRAGPGAGNHDPAPAPYPDYYTTDPRLN